jgi:Tol biopolymer transport system component
MVFTQTAPQPSDIWRVPGRTATASDEAPKKLTGSSRADFNPAYSPDGQRIAFSSRRSGFLSIWVSDSDGSHPVQLTSFKGHTGTPRWSPDSRRIVFDSVEEGDWNLYIIDADGGVPWRLTQESSTDAVGTWSHDGRWIYFASDRSGSWQTWKIPAEGGEAVQVTQGGGHYAQESWDGRDLYFVRSIAGSGIWRVPVEGGDEAEVVSGPVDPFGDWALSRNGLYYAAERTQARREEYTIQYLDFESGRTTELFRKDGPFGHGWITVSPGEEWILFSEWPLSQSELMLMENFR